MARNNQNRNTNTNTNTNTYFFDSWGGLWAQCPKNHPEATGFGPCYTARPVKLAEQVQLGLLQAGHFTQDSPIMRALWQGRVRSRNGWSYLLPPR